MLTNMNEADEIIPGLWLGSYPRDSASSYTRVFCVTDAGFGPMYGDTQVVIRCPLKDTVRMPPIDTIENLAEMVNDAVEAGHKTLVHCTAGINRSSLIVALALIKRGWKGRDAVDHLRKVRGPVVLMNDTFSEWLCNRA